ncbi:MULTISPECIES: hypothetical protein [Empedobacter]|uniref:Uncharacterized protein n=1 Tax=Empedobacter falsenii TaxID=343874 RepID=A0A7H9DSD3_9FLAO|nr:MULTISPECIES: hypothetical protein [Empedobacter]QLL58113.1 hypothetical protein FH779_08485 [Empedobacter falsenii]
MLNFFLKSNKTDIVENLYHFIKKYRFKNKHFWEAKGGIEIYKYLSDFSDSDFDKLKDNLSGWKNYSIKILINCTIKGLNRMYTTDYDTQPIFVRLYSFLSKDLQHLISSKWEGNYITHSKSETNNYKIQDIYYYILKNTHVDGDFWSMGGRK